MSKQITDSNTPWEVEGHVVFGPGHVFGDPPAADWEDRYSKGWNDALEHTVSIVEQLFASSHPVTCEALVHSILWSKK